MITGFNTDIKHGGTTYHVQTEDKGLDSPLILSLVYVGGAIIAAKRTPYEDLVSAGFDEKELTQRLQRQHKLICAAIKQGRVNELKKMSAPNGGAKAEDDAAKEAAAPAPDDASKASGQRKKKSDAPPPAEAAPPVETAPTVESATPAETAPPPVETAQAPVEAPPRPVESAAPTAETVAPPADTAAPQVKAAPPAATSTPSPERPVDSPAAQPAAQPAKPSKPPIKSPIEISRVPPGRRNAGPAAGKAEQDVVILTTLADEVSALGDYFNRPAPAAEAPPADEPIPVEPIPVEPLEEDISEAPRDVTDGLDLRLLDDEGDFRAGQLATIKIYVGRGDYGQRPIFDASVTVKVLGSSFRPIILTTTTDMAGVAVVRALLPRFTSGRAAIIIRATVGEDSAELRRIIRQQ